MPTIPKLPPARALLERAVFLTQLLLSGATVLLLLVTLAVYPRAFIETEFFVGIVIIFVVTALAAAVPWSSTPRSLIAVLPCLDIAALCLMREAQPTLGASFLLVFPVIWMATHFGVRGAATSVLLSAAFIWGGTLAQGIAVNPADIPRLAVVPIVLAFVAATTHATTRRTTAQRDLLMQQAGLFEAALRRSRRQEQTLGEIFHAVDFGVVGFDASGKPNVVNRAQWEMLARFGMTPGRAIPDVLYADDRVSRIPEGDRPYMRALRGEAVDRDLVWVGEPGQARGALLVSARPVFDEAGDFDGGVLVSRDVTVEMRAIESRDDLVASVSHELRTPLTSILGYLELSLDDERLAPETRRMLTVASTNADRLLALVADLLAAASDSKDPLTLNRAPCQLAAIVDDGIESIRPLAAERDITFDVGELPSLTVDVDAFRIRQVVDNILSNAVKYNELSGRISVAITSNNGTAELRVTDTGRGMTDEEQKNLFDRFYRADSVRGSSVHGTGLGLSISRDIMRQHGGDLRLESVSGEGATAIATLPLATPALTTHELATPALATPPLAP